MLKNKALKIPPPYHKIPESIDVHLHQLSKSFAERWVLQRLSYHFKAGESYLVLGANGSGKSTLLSLITGFYRPSRGSIQYLSQGRQIQATYKHFGLVAPYIDIPALRVEEAIALSTQLLPGTKAFNILLSEIGLMQHRKQCVSTLSSGMRQRVLLGMVFGHPPPIILLDEPFHHLDAQYKDYCVRAIRSCADAGCLVIVCSPDISDQVFADHTLLLAPKLVDQKILTK